MKGLLIKDFCLLKGQKRIWIVVLVITILFFGIFDNPAFVICYLSVMVAMFTLSTLSYDEFQNGMSYLLTMPVSRIGYVQEKYVFSFAVTVATAGLGYLLTAAVGLAKGGHYENGELLSSAVAGILIAMTLIGVAFPLQLKFGTEKGRLALFCVYGGCIVAAYMAKELFRVPFDDIFAAIDRFLENELTAAAACLGAGIAVMLVSYCISLCVIKRKEF